MKNFINRTLAEMRYKEEKERENIIGLIMRKCGRKHLVIDEHELGQSRLNEVQQIYDNKNHCIILTLKGEIKKWEKTGKQNKNLLEDMEQNVL